MCSREETSYLCNLQILLEKLYMIKAFSQWRLLEALSRAGKISSLDSTAGLERERFQPEAPDNLGDMLTSPVLVI